MGWVSFPSTFLGYFVLLRVTGNIFAAQTLEQPITAVFRHAAII